MTDLLRTLLIFAIFSAWTLIVWKLAKRDAKFNEAEQRDAADTAMLDAIIRDATAEHECAVIDPARGTVRVLRWSGPGLTQGFGGRC